MLVHNGMGGGMPRKIRQLKADLRRAGFVERKGRGKGSHTMWEHARLPEITVVLAGRDGDDADHYQEKQIREAIARAQQPNLPREGRCND
jgi:hypothetical protein